MMNGDGWNERGKREIKWRFGMVNGDGGDERGKREEKWRFGMG